MLSIKQMTPDHWSHVLTNYSQQKDLNRIKVEEIYLSDEQIVEITQDKIQKTLSRSVLEKTITAFKALVSQRKNALHLSTFTLNSFAVKFTRWANSHSTLAKILCIVTMGIFWMVWKRGYSYLQQEQKIRASMQTYQKIEAALQQKLIALTPSKEEGFQMPKELFSIAIEYLSTKEKKELLGWKPVEEALIYLDQRKWKMVESYQKKIIEHLDKTKFKDEIEKLKKLKEHLRDCEEFNDPLLPYKEKEAIILDIISLILPLRNIKIQKKFRNLLQDKFFALMAMNMHSSLGIPLSLFPESLQKDKEILIAATHKNGFRTNPATIPEDLKENKKLLLAYILVAPISITRTSLKNNRQFVLEAVRTNGDVYKHLSDAFKTEREIALESIKSRGLVMEDLPEEFKKDPEIALEAIKQNGKAFQYIHPDLKKCQNMILAALSKYPSAFEFLENKNLNGNKDFMLLVLGLNGSLLKYASDNLKKDKEVVMKAVCQYGPALEFADLFNDDIQVVSAAIEEYFLAFEHASKNLKNNKTMGLAAVKKSWEVLHQLSDQLKDDEDIVLTCVKQYGGSLETASSRLKNDRQFILKAVEKWGTYKHISHELKKDPEILIKALKVDPYAFQDTSDPLKNDNKLCLMSVTRQGLLLEFASAELQDNEDVVLGAMKQNGDALKFASNRLRNDKNFLIKALSQNHASALGVKHVPHPHCNDKSIILSVVSRNGLALELVPLQFRNYKDVVLAAVKENDYVLQIVSETLQKDQDILDLLRSEDPPKED